MDLCVIGSGFVGQATGKGFCKHGHNVRFLDVASEKVAQLREGGFDAYHPDEHEGLHGDVTLFCISTPTVGSSIVLDHLLSGVESFARKLKEHNAYHVVVIRSTVVPGTTVERVVPLIEKVSGKKAGEDFGVCMQPEFLRQVTAEADFDRPWVILIGELDARSGDVVADLYKSFNAPIERTSIHEAEAQKYIHNLYNAAKIAFFNEMRLVCEREGWDAEQIFPIVAQSCEGIWNPLYGLRDKGPFDGACLPKDTQAFYDWGTKRGHDLELLGSVINQNHRYRKHYQKKASVGDLKVAESHA